MKSVDEEVSSGGERHKTLEADIIDIKLKIELKDFSRKSVKNADQNTAAPLIKAIEVKDELCRVAEKRNKFKGRLTEAEIESRCRLIRLNNLLFKQICMSKAFHGVIGQIVSVFDGFGNRVGGGLTDSFCTVLRRRIPTICARVQWSRLTSPGLVLPA